MNVVILGATRVGVYVASRLSEEGHDVVVVDSDAQRLERLSRETDVATLHTHPPSWRAFPELLDSHPLLLFAATDSDDENVAACAIGKNLGFPKTIALVKQREYLAHPRLDIGRLFYTDHFLSADLFAAQDLHKLLLHTHDIAADYFAHGAIQMRTLAIPERWDLGGTPIRDLALPDDLIVGLIRRKVAGGEEIIFPHGEDHLLPGDEVTVIGESRAMHRVGDLFHLAEHPLRSVVIVGGSTVAYHLAHLLAQQGVDVRIIESDPLRCERLAERLPHATLINRDGRDLRCLQGERIAEADAIVACSDTEETNLLVAGLARELNCQRVIALVSNPQLSPLLEHLQVVPALSAQVHVANRVLSILHEEALLSVTSICNDHAKIVEIKISPHSRLIGFPLVDLKSHFPRDLLIAAIENQGRVMIGRGNRILSPNDTAIVVTASRHLPQLPELFG